MNPLKRKDPPGSHGHPAGAKESKDSASARTNPPRTARGTKKASTDVVPKTERPEKSSLIQTRKEEPLFARGGGSILTPLEKKKIQIQAREDVLFEDESKADISKPAKRIKGDRKKSSGPAVKDEGAVKIESLNYKVCGQLVCSAVDE